MSQKVVTIKNDEQPKESCRKIGKNFYLMNRDVFEIDGKWVREPLTFVDNYDGKRKLRSEHEYSVVYNNLTERQAVTTTKTIDIYTRVGVQKVCASALKVANVIPAWFAENTFVDKNYKSVHPIRKPSIKYYGINDNPNTSRLIESKKEESNDFNNIKKQLQELTFGFEIETSNGEILEKVANDFKFVRLYDGSISGHEFVSIPLKVENFDYVKQFCNLLGKACSKNMFCSTHIHVGGIPFSTENFTSIFSLFKRLEHEIHALVPPYKKSVQYFVAKRNNGLGEIKDHCKYLPDHLDLAFGAKNPSSFTQQAATYFAGGNRIGVGGLGTDRYRNLFEGRKWNMNRYFFVNFVNYLFKEGGTIEFRLLESTFSFDNILYWLLLNVAITKYAIKEQKRVFDRKEKITLEDCVNGIYSNEIAEKVISWMHFRRTKYSNYLNSMDDFSGEIHFSNEQDISEVKW